MLHNEINKHIAAAMKSHDADRLYVLKMIKAKFLEFQTSKGFKEEDFKELTKVVKEIEILPNLPKEKFNKA